MESLRALKKCVFNSKFSLYYDNKKAYFVISIYLYSKKTLQNSTFFYSNHYFSSFSLFFMGIDYFGPTAPPPPRPSPFTRHYIFFALERKKKGFFHPIFLKLFPAFFMAPLKNNVIIGAVLFFTSKIA